ncbi:Rossmann-like and DUF2520 domain-containing protein [Wenyingzhuangia sp. 2_MG-2023]|uniref:Rossmann-like and DUF2520 domain-containing protein n=1 Tax=Wenyingzhuangia sp. 2_MG-2023 TaxID=3062639 RepID=UPI0026E2B4E2|nr:Rossmann-like and DUF2520 domain-containing protein [Wenyingzhuangia sp. 2_MG-2023]MDO6739132.1 DUF2520 domain-containing protein [Wenyingzhuangia sp. 2_MG-2023]MDO6803577.1 DUF2520 domain-containing protein [Wenyingzhuangia sp. 1_MG-2023]
MTKVCILGAGKVGTHFIKECINNPAIELIQIFNRSQKGIQLYQNSIPTTQSVYELKKADLYLVALPDDVIATLDLNHLKGLVAHTSGTLAFTNLQAQNRAVLYPLQSFSKEKKIHFKKLPLCLETEFEKDYKILREFAYSLSDAVYAIDASKRQKIHLAAVFANNFSNRMMGIAYDLCKEHQIDFEILQPLLQETFLKTQILPPHIAQTGPALRNDQQTIIKHMDQLTGTNKTIYQLITQSIQEKHGTEL